MKIIDISAPLKNDIPSWPGSDGFSMFSQNLNKINQSSPLTIKMDVHSGTHIDAPSHFLDKGKSIDQIPLNKFCGEVFVADITGESIVSAKLLSSIKIPNKTKRILFKTDNGMWYKNKSFNKNYIGLDIDAAKWIVDNKVELVGIDYLSIATFNCIKSVHLELLNNNIIIIEGLALANVPEGIYQLFSFPISIEGADGSPVRAVLVKNTI